MKYKDLSILWQLLPIYYLLLQTPSSVLLTTPLLIQTPDLLTLDSSVYFPSKYLLIFPIYIYILRSIILVSLFYSSCLFWNIICMPLQILPLFLNLY